MANLKYIEGVGEGYAEKLAEAGIKNVDSLLAAGDTKAKRKKLAETTGISEKLILKFINRSDLMRIKGVGSEYSDLLELAGVDTVPELSKRKPDNLFAKMVEVNTEKKLVRKLPTEKQVTDWVEQAKALPRIISY